MALALRMVGRHDHTGRERLAERPRTRGLVKKALRARVDAGGNPQHQRRLSGLVNLERARVLAPVNFRQGDKLGVLNITENRFDVFRAGRANKRGRKPVRVGIGDLVNPLGFEVLKLVLVNMDKEPESFNGGRNTQAESLSPYVRQDTGESRPYLCLTALAL